MSGDRSDPNASAEADGAPEADGVDLGDGRHQVRTRRIVVGADISAAGSAALLWGMRQARRSDSHVMVLDSRPLALVASTDAGGRSTGGSAPEADGSDVLRKEHRWQVQTWVSEVVMSVASRVPVLVSTTEGRLELALAGAGSRADLVVFGEGDVHGGELDADVLLRFCPCPVVRVNRHQVPTWLGGRG